MKKQSSDNVQWRPDGKRRSLRELVTATDPTSAEYVASQRELLEAVVIPELALAVRERWPEGTVTLALGSVGVPDLSTRYADREVRQQRWIARIRTDGDFAKTAEFEISWPLDVEADEAIANIDEQIRRRP